MTRNSVGERLLAPDASGPGERASPFAFGTGQASSHAAAIDELFDGSIVIDSLCLENRWDEPDIAAWKASGYTAIQTTLSSGGSRQVPWSEGNFAVAMQALKDWQERFRQHPDTFVHCTRAEHIDRAKRERKLAVILGFQNAPLHDDVANLERLYEAGARCIQLTNNSRNNLGDGCTERLTTGLSDFGIACVEKMDQLGIVVDLSHCGEGTTSDGIAFAKQPCFTHTVCQALHFHPRAKSDALLRGLASKGGIVGIATLGYFVKSASDVSLDDYISHINHAVTVCGIDHVGLSTDYAIRGIEATQTRESWYFPRLTWLKPSYNVRWPPWIPELDRPDRFRTLAHGLSRRGYKNQDIEKILGGNWLRYFRHVFKA